MSLLAAFDSMICYLFINLSINTIPAAFLGSGQDILIIKNNREPDLGLELQQQPSQAYILVTDPAMKKMSSISRMILIKIPT